MAFSAICDFNIDKLVVSYSLFADLDPSHRGLLKLNYKNANLPATKTAIFSPDAALQTFVLEKPSRLTEFKAYVIEGIWHIWKGFDHVLFLISLLVTAVLIYDHKKWEAAPHF